MFKDKIFVSEHLIIPIRITEFAKFKMRFKFQQSKKRKVRANLESVLR